MDATLITVIGTLSGTLIGTLGTWIINDQKNKNDNKQAEQRRRWELEDKERAESYEKEQNKFLAYNKILKSASEHMIVTTGNYINLRDFKIKIYMDNVRPLIYENLHILDKEVVSRVRKIDTEIDKMNYLVDSEPEWIDYCAQLYDEMLEMIEHKYLD
ncbi:hypothetical protein FB479_102700 [Brevibacillus sp. AG162]|uniref:hypothetical protein n=1 Tax=Brevibacillus sp. AG162 TaxID=2572910 RepID=UPI0011522006|nr:hypothetical protein [Brevibacillus sp. AG162]TQK74060.1 hypothetical protein FB479_102700 [Brevibacillus sp. AG162]